MVESLCVHVNAFGKEYPTCLLQDRQGTFKHVSKQHIRYNHSLTIPTDETYSTTTIFLVAVNSPAVTV